MSATANRLSQPQALISQGNTFAASKGKQYEAGVKYAPKDRPITASVALYQLTKTNNKVADLEHPFFSVQGGEVRSRGIELEAKAALSANLNLLGSYTYTDAEYTKRYFATGEYTFRYPLNTWLLCGRITPSMKLRLAV